MPGARVAAKTRDLIAAAIEAELPGGKPKWTKIGQRFGVSGSLVKHIAVERKLWASAPASPATQVAIDAHRQQARAIRSALAPRLLELAARFAEQAVSPAKVYKFGGRDNEYAEHELDEPDFAGKQALANSITQLVNTALAIERHDMGEGEDSKGAILSLVEKLRERREGEAAS